MLKIKSAKVQYSHSCVMLSFPDSLAKRIKAWCRDNIPAKDVSTEGDAKGRESQIHCTIKYGLHTNEVNKVRKVLDGFGNISVRLGKISRFISNDDFDVVKIEVESDDLRRLHYLFGKLPNSDKHKEYKPHATISYIDKGSSYELSGDTTFSGEEFKLDSVVFSPATGDKITLKL